MGQSQEFLIAFTNTSAHASPENNAVIHHSGHQLPYVRSLTSDREKQAIKGFCPLHFIFKCLQLWFHKFLKHLTTSESRDAKILQSPLLGIISIENNTVNRKLLAFFFKYTANINRCKLSVLTVCLLEPVHHNGQIPECNNIRRKEGLF